MSFWQLFLASDFPSVLDEFKGFLFFSYPWCTEIEVFSESFTLSFSCFPWTLEAFFKKDTFFIFLLSTWSVISFWNIFLDSSQNLFQCLLSIHGFRIKFPTEGFLRKSRFKSGVSNTRQPWDISFYFVLENRATIKDQRELTERTQESPW